AIFDQMDSATQAVVDITAAGIIPAALEMMDHTTIEAIERGAPVGFPRDAEAVLIVEVEGLGEQTERSMNLARAVCERNGAREVRMAKDETERQLLWKGRKGAFGAMGALAPNYYVQDGVVPRSKLSQVLRKVYETCERYGLPVANVFHAGDGNLHPNLLFDERKPGETARVLEVGAEIMRLCVDAGGSITGEHGVGVEKIDQMCVQFGTAELEAFHAIKRVFDPKGLLNPGKAVPLLSRCAEFGRRHVRAGRLDHPDLPRF
ncbi:MAG: FAD-linked oxidase C-terminal domain-containing protein, partial [Terriglobales bacterium]